MQTEILLGAVLQINSEEQQELLNELSSLDLKNKSRLLELLDVVTEFIEAGIGEKLVVAENMFGIGKE